MIAETPHKDIKANLIYSLKICANKPQRDNNQGPTYQFEYSEVPQIIWLRTQTFMCIYYYQYYIDVRLERFTLR